MAERGIIFSAPMVRALLDGRKTQTRRLVKCPADMPDHFQLVGTEAKTGRFEWEAWKGGAPYFGWPVGEHFLRDRIWTPAIGDRLYVREHWSVEPTYDAIPPRFLLPTTPVLTRADWQWHQSGDVTGRAFGKHRQGMHMPRWASRLTLTVTDVRVQRLQEISEEDARAEGIGLHKLSPDDAYANLFKIELADGRRVTSTHAVPLFALLWNSLHDKPGTRWEDNPWLYALTFTVQHGNIDRIAQ